jgi:seryl-tRNA synthetase
VGQQTTLGITDKVEVKFSPAKIWRKVTKMVRKPRRPKVQHVIKNLLDLEIPEIQSMASKLAEQIKDLEEQSSRLQEYVAEIENMATDQSNAMVEGRISEILKDLDSALRELRQKPKKALPAGTESRAIVPRRVAVEEEPEEEEEEEIEEKAEPGPGMKLERVVTPEGYIVKKARY